MEEKEQKRLSLIWPDALIKALYDTFDYLVVLDNGERIYFHKAVYINDNWVRVIQEKSLDGCLPSAHGFCGDRGSDINISKIVYVCDAPHGS